MGKKPCDGWWLLLLLMFGAQALEFHNVRSGENQRGGSFGLENFLMQPFDEEDFNGEINVEVKKETPKKPLRGQTYGLESMTQDLSENFQQNEDQDRRRPHHRFDENKVDEKNKYSRPTNLNVKENFKRNELVTETIRKPLERPITFRKPDHSEKPGENDETIARPRKRIAMRRRKRPLATPATTQNVEAQTEENENTSVPTTMAIATFSTPFDADSRPEQVHQSKRKRPMGFRVHASTKESEQLKKKTEEEEIKKVKVEEKIAQEELLPTAGPEGDSAEVKSSNRLKLFLKRHQTGTVSLSELLQTRNLSLTDFLAGEKDLAAAGPVEVDGSTESPRRNIKSRLDTVSSPSPATSSISVKSRPFSKSENSERPNRYTKKKIEEGNENHVSSEIHESRDDKPEYNGFTPKNPRRFKKPERNEREEEENSKILTNDKKVLEEKPSKINQQQEISLKNFSTKSFWNTENRKVSELNYRRKLKIPKADIPKVDSETTTDLPFFDDQQASSTTVPIKSNDERKKLKTPFKSSNNPELALIFSNEKSKTYFNDRIGGMKFPGSSGEKEEEKEKPVKEVHIFKETPKTESENPLVKNTKSYYGTTSDTYNGRKKEKTRESEMEQVLEYESKDEILELLKSASTAQKLEKILASRNMTIGELLLNREKGSAQTNFSRLFVETTKFPSSTRSTPTKKEEDANLYSLESDKRSTFSEEMETDETSLINNRIRIQQIESENQGEKSKKTETSFNQFSPKRGEKTMDYSLFSTMTDEEPVVQAIITPTAKSRAVDDYYYRESKFAAKTLSSENAQDAFSLNQDVNKKLETEEIKVDKSFIPPVIKSTIIISGVVMGIALFVFIAIFAACGWRQRQLRLKADSSILNETLTAKSDPKKKSSSSSRTLSPKRSSTYKKTLEFDDSRSVISVSSEASSYLWNTLKNTFTSRNNTLKNRLEKESCLKSRAGGKKGNGPEVNKKYEERLNSLRRENEKYHSKKNYSEKDLIRTTDSFKRGVVITNQTSSNNNYRFDNWSQS